MSKFFTTSSLFLLIFFFVACGGDESSEEVVTSEEKTEEIIPEPSIPEVEEPVAANIPPPKPKEVKVPNPNGVYLPTGEEKNGKPVYANADGFVMWYNGSTWRITDRTGGGNLVASEMKILTVNGVMEERFAIIRMTNLQRTLYSD